MDLRSEAQRLRAEANALLRDADILEKSVADVYETGDVIRFQHWYSTKSKPYIVAAIKIDTGLWQSTSGLHTHPVKWVTLIERYPSVGRGQFEKLVPYV